MSKPPQLNLSDAYWFQEGPGIRNWQFTTSGIKLLNVGNIEKSERINLAKTDRHISLEEAHGKYKHFLCDEGDLVIASSGISIDDDGYLRTRGAFIESEHLPLCINTSTIRFKSKNGNELRYLKHWLQSNEFRNQITKLVTGSAQLNFGPSHLKQLKINLPPLAQQQRIAAILDKAAEINAKREQAITKLDELAQSTFVEMFGDFEKNTKNHPIVLLSSLVSVQGGYAFKSSDYLMTVIRLVKISNVHKDNLIWNEKEFLPEEFLKQYSEYELRSNDIVMALTRPIIKSLNSVKVAVVNKDDLPCLLNQRVARFIFKDHSKINSSFLKAFLKTKYFYNLVDSLCSTALQPNISSKQIESIRIPLPSLSEQIKYECIVNNLNCTAVHMKKSLKVSNDCVMSLQHQAFTTGFTA